MRKKAFTLVELLVVIGIIAVLISILLPSLAKSRRAAQQLLCASNLRQLGYAFTLYAQDWQEMYPAADDSASPWLWMGRGFRPKLELYAQRGGDSPGIFFCPADPTAAATWDSTSYAYSMSFYHSPQQINAITATADTMPPSAAPAARPQKLSGVKYPTQKVLAGEWLSVHYPFEGDKGWHGPGGTRTFLFADGHAAPVLAKDILPANDGNPNPNLTRDGVQGRDVQ